MDLERLESDRLIVGKHMRMNIKAGRSTCGGGRGGDNGCGCGAGVALKSVSYQHRYTVLPEVDNTSMSSQVPLGPDVLSSPNHVSQLETADPSVELKEKELIGE
ncbi:hypothetical protein U1Q18_016377 [Sarracenia purpurea var. burkii]